MKFIKETPNKNWKVPTTKSKGNVVFHDYADSWFEDREGFKFVENFIFEATLKPDRTYRGRSAAGFIFIDADDGTNFTMRIAKTEEFLQAILSGKVKVTKEGYKGQFTFAKQGANYSIMVAK